MFRYKLRTLLILLAILPPLLAEGWWKYSKWRADQVRRAAIERELKEIIAGLNFWMKTQTGPQFTPAGREAAILRLEDRAMPLNREKGQTR